MWLVTANLFHSCFNHCTERSWGNYSVSSGRIQILRPFWFSTFKWLLSHRRGCWVNSSVSRTTVQEAGSPAASCDPTGRSLPVMSRLSSLPGAERDGKQPARQITVLGLDLAGQNWRFHNQQRIRQILGVVFRVVLSWRHHKLFLSRLKKNTGHPSLRQWWSTL